MKILTKRIFAVFVDGHIHAFIVAGIQFLLPEWFTEYYLTAFLIIPFFFKDLLFKNASLGKIIFGLRIYDKNWEKPKLRVLTLRAAYTFTMGCVKLQRLIMLGGSYIEIFDWEREKFGTCVIDKKVYRKLALIAREQGGDFAHNMTELYTAYLRDMYVK